MDIHIFIADYRKGIPLHKICKIRGFERIEALLLIEQIKTANKANNRINQAFKELITERYLNGASIQSMSCEIGSTWATIRKWINEIVEQRYGKVV